MAEFAGCLYGEGLTTESLTQIAQKHGLVVVTDGSKPKENIGKSILLIARPQIAGLLGWLEIPYAAYVEEIDPAEGLPEETLLSIGKSSLTFSMATDSAYQMDSAALVCEALTARGVLSPMRRQDVELSLHETISNAVVHGNLELESAKKGSYENMTNFAMQLMQRMQSPEAKRRVEIRANWDSEFLDITVSDCGRGYDESKLPVSDPFAPAGRGLAIIRSLTLAMNVTNGGRVTTLRFLT